MSKDVRPQNGPQNPNFSSGPCAKIPGWTPELLSNAFLGRSHRSKLGKERLSLAIEQTRKILGVPENYKIGIVPASDTGAVEMALWSLLGPNPVDILAWESFGKGWVSDIVSQLKLEGVNVYEADYGHIPDLSQVNSAHDIVFTWNGTTSGVRVPNADWIDANRTGLSICDATSAAFAMDLNWQKLDCTTFSWQKVLGGEAQHGIIILSPKAVERLESYTPTWPMPKIFRMTKKGKLIDGIFKGETINTPSMLVVEDYLAALNWAEKIGGLGGLITRSKANSDAIYKWVEQSNWIDCLVPNPELRSTTSVCLKLKDKFVTSLPDEQQQLLVKKMLALLDTEGVAYDIGAYRDAPTGLRIWAGATVELSDLEALFPWLDWAFQSVKKTFQE